MLDAQSYFLQAEQYRKRNLVPQAVECYELALSIDPGHEDSLFHLGFCYLPESQAGADQLGLSYQDMNTKAAACFKALLELRERKGTITRESYAAYFNLGLALRNLQNNEEALPCFARAVNLNQEHERSFFLKGVCELDLGKEVEAIESFKKAAQLDPQKKGTYRNLAYLYLGTNQLKEAEDATVRGLALDPNDADLHYKLGIARGSQGQHEAARDSFRKAVELDPEADAAHYNLWLACLNCKDTKTGTRVEVCESGGFLPADSGTWVSSKAVSRQEEALMHLEKAAELNSKYCYTLAEIHKNHGRYQKALENFEAYCRAAEGNARIDRQQVEKSRKYAAWCRKKIELFGPKEE